MPRFALVNGALVENVLLADVAPLVADVAPIVAGRAIVGPLAAGQAVGPGDAYDGANFTPHVLTAAERTRATAPQFLRVAYPVLRQWATDAQATYDAATLAARGLTPAEQREFMRRMGLLMVNLADLLVMLSAADA